MAETQPKRPRQEEEEEYSNSNEYDNPKRQKPYNNILNLLEEEEEDGEPSHEPSQESLSAIFTTLEQELSSDSTTTTTTDAAAAAFDLDSLPCTAAEAEADMSAPTTGSDTSAEDVKTVMRHLLEASDDELGIPNENNNNNNVEEINSGENFPFIFSENIYGFWEIEDEAANYYTVLQSELFM